MTLGGKLLQKKLRRSCFTKKHKFNERALKMVEAHRGHRRVFKTKDEIFTVLA